MDRNSIKKTVFETILLLEIESHFVPIGLDNTALFTLEKYHFSPDFHPVIRCCLSLCTLLHFSHTTKWMFVTDFTILGILYQLSPYQERELTYMYVTRIDLIDLTLSKQSASEENVRFSYR
jgi:hypothetical protein